MEPLSIAILIATYFLVLVGISWFTSRKASNDTFFIGDRSSSWYLVAFGMIGTSLSGVTFVSIPGIVQGAGFGYMQIVFGYFIGYVLITTVLLPIYYKYNLISIYSFLGKKIGPWAYKTGAFYFLISRVAGASIRLLLVAGIFHAFVFEAWGFPFWASVTLSILLIWIYTHRGGIKTIVWTDSLQTLFMLVSLGLTIYVLLDASDLSLSQAISECKTLGLTKMWFTEDINAKNFYIKELLGGMLIAFCMTGLDQDMMQKNLSCPDIKSAQKNVLSFASVLVLVNLAFLFLGAMLYLYAGKAGIELPLTEKGEIRTDHVFPELALNQIGNTWVALLFILGLVAAAYSSADSALTSLTTTICFDFMGIEKKGKKEGMKLRRTVHILVSLSVLGVVLLFNEILDKSAIDQALFMGSLTYGPLLGLFCFAILARRKASDNVVPIACLVSPVATYFLVKFSPEWFDGYEFHFEALGVNGLLTFIILYVSSIFVNQRNQQGTQ